MFWAAERAGDAVRLRNASYVKTKWLVSMVIGEHLHGTFSAQWSVILTDDEMTRVRLTHCSRSSNFGLLCLSSGHGRCSMKTESKLSETLVNARSPPIERLRTNDCHVHHLNSRPTFYATLLLVPGRIALQVFEVFEAFCHHHPKTSSLLDCHTCNSKVCEAEIPVRFLAAMHDKYRDRTPVSYVFRSTELVSFIKLALL